MMNSGISILGFNSADVFKLQCHSAQSVQASLTVADRLSKTMQTSRCLWSTHVMVNRNKENVILPHLLMLRDIVAQSALHQDKIYGVFAAPRSNTGGSLD